MRERSCRLKKLKKFLQQSIFFRESVIKKSRHFFKRWTVKPSDDLTLWSSIFSLFSFRKRKKFQGLLRDCFQKFKKKKKSCRAQTVCHSPAILSHWFRTLDNKTNWKFKLNFTQICDSEKELSHHLLISNPSGKSFRDKMLNMEWWWQWFAYGSENISSYCYPTFFITEFFVTQQQGVFADPETKTILQSPNLTQWLTHLRNSFVLTKWHDWQSETPIFSSEKTTIDSSSSPFFHPRPDRKLHFVQNFFHTVRKDLNLANKKFVITHIKDFHWKLGRMLEISEICADLCKELHLFRIYSSHQNTYRTLVMEKIFVFWNTVFLTHNQFAET